MISETAATDQETAPGNTSAAGEEFLEITNHTGLDYLSALAAFHRRVQPNAYFEIGTLAGATLALANCASVAVDPKFVIDQNVVGAKPSCALFQMTSDDFFARHDPKAMLGGPIGLAFLDGMHLFEYLLRDFMNTEANCSANSLILMHDCLPTDSHVGRRDWQDRRFAERTKTPNWWAGDVWKAAYILLERRPDLEIYGLNSPPTGLIAITHLDPGSRTLARHYDEIVREYESIELHSCIQTYLRRIKMIDTVEFIESELVGKLGHA